MKVLVISDVHGNWNETIDFIKNKKDNVDKVVCLGDYVDDFDEDLNGLNMIVGFKKLCEMAKAESEKFCICIGNHDLSYISDPNVSGHHYLYSIVYRRMFMENINLMKICYEIDGYVFSHAGVSETWYNDFLLPYIKQFDDIIENKNPVTLINYAFDSGLFYLFDYNVKAIDWGDGNSKEQGPLWIRPEALSHCSMFEKQVIGHTELRYEAPYLLEINNIKLYLTDTSTHNAYCLLDTESGNIELIKK